MSSRLILHIALSAVLIYVLIDGTASARVVYRCTNAHGDVTLQDPPCAKGDRQTAIPVEDDPAQPAPATITPVEPIAAAVPAVKPPPAPVAPVVAPPPLPRRPLPTLWLCTRPEDGSHYITHDGSAPSRLVPAGILGIPGKSLAQTYGGGGGVSAPGMHKAPTSTFPHDAVAADFVEVHDDCAPTSAEQACDYLRSELDSVEEKLLNASKDDRAVLEPRRQDLRDQLDGC